MRVALFRQLGVRVAHEPGLPGAQHHLQVRALDAHVLEAVDDVGGAGDAVPLSEHRLRAASLAVLEEHLDLAFEDEERLLDRMRVGGIALARRHVHDRQREMLGGDGLDVTLAGRAGADVAMLRPAEAFDARVGESIPVRDTIDEAGDAALEQVLDLHGVLRAQVRMAAASQSYHSGRGKSTARAAEERRVSGACEAANARRARPPGGSRMADDRRARRAPWSGAARS